jgi:hypothetical protein
MPLPSKRHKKIRKFVEKLKTLDTNPDPGAKFNADPVPKHCQRRRAAMLSSVKQLK